MAEASLLRILGTVARIFQSTRHRRVDNTGLDHRDSHVESLHLLGESLAERFQGELGGGVGRKRGSGDATGYRAYVDDASTLAPAHMRDHLLNAPDRAKVVGLHHGAEFVQGQFFNRSIPLHPRVVDQHIAVAGILVYVGDRCFHRAVRVNVHDRNLDWKPLVRSLFPQFRSARRVAHGGIYGVARPTQGKSSFEPDPCTCSSNEYGRHGVCSFRVYRQRGSSVHPIPLWPPLAKSPKTRSSLVGFRTLKPRTFPLCNELE